MSTFIDPNYQGKGIFKKLVVFIEKEISKKYNKYYLFVHNVPMSGKGFVQNKRWELIRKIKYSFCNRYLFNLLSLIKKMKIFSISEFSDFSNLDSFLSNICYSNKKIFKFINAKIFNWRFVNHPYKKFFTYKLKRKINYIRF